MEVNTINEFIRSQRIGHELTIDALSAQAGLHRSVIQRLEREQGRKQLVIIDNVLNIFGYGLQIVEATNVRDD